MILCESLQTNICSHQKVPLPLDNKVHQTNKKSSFKSLSNKFTDWLDSELTTNTQEINIPTRLVEVDRGGQR